MTAWDGAFNLGDLGGIALVVGGSTRHGHVFRSGSREHVTEIGWLDAVAAGLSTVVDLRNADEIGREPHHPVVSDAALAGVEVVSCPTEDPDDPEFSRVLRPWLDHPRSYGDNLAMYPEKFRRVFETVAASSGNVLIHCSAGRDRTGMVSAVLLKLAGAADDAIADDYEAAVIRVNDYLRANPGHAREEPHADDALRLRLTERRAAMLAWLSGFNADLHLRAIGLSDGAIMRLRGKLTNR